MCKVPPLETTAATIVVGFSVRALAEATRAAIGPPLAVDHFADHDCRQLAKRVVRLKRWGGNVLKPDRLLRELSDAGATSRSAVLLGGGMENWPELLDLLHAHFTMLGPSTDQHRHLRNPACWQRWAQRADVAFPETAFPGTARAVPQHRDRQQENPLPQANWLIKPRHGAGGYSIRWSHALPGQKALSTSDPGEGGTYRQQHVKGRGLGAYCLLRRDGSPQLLGASESLSAEEWPGPSEFIYRGSLGPIGLPPHHSRQILALCQVIQQETGMLGWLQLDFIEDPAGKLWLLELNPRWAAGMEVLYLSGINPVEHHCRVWQPASALDDSTQHHRTSSDISANAKPPSSAPVRSPAYLPREPAQNSYGKAIVYAPRELQLTHRQIDWLHNLPRDNFADLPSHQLIPHGQSGHLVAAGEPLLTVRAGGPREDLLEKLATLREAALAGLAGS